MWKTVAMVAPVIGMAFAAVAVWGGAGKEATAQTQPAVADKPKDMTLDLGNGVWLKLVQIPAGRFTMGSSDDEKKAAIKEAVAAGVPAAMAPDLFKDEVQHQVAISKPFYMGVTHVTVDQFAAFVKDSGYKTDAEKDGWSAGIEIKDGQVVVSKVDGGSWRNPGFDQKGDHPVVQVTWNDATAFCVWLSKKSGKMVTLPTEAQWEYACRAGTTTTYPWGDAPDGGKGWANCADQSLKKKLPNEPANMKFFSWDDGYVFTSPAASFKPNAFGLYDMIGNAWQWCQDHYGDYDNQAVTDPMGAVAGGCRVLRGGCWNDHPDNCRTACRNGSIPDGRSINGIGFRVAVGAD